MSSKVKIPGFRIMNSVSKLTCPRRFVERNLSLSGHVKNAWPNGNTRFPVIRIIRMSRGLTRVASATLVWSPIDDLEYLHCIPTCPGLLISEPYPKTRIDFVSEIVNNSIKTDKSVETAVLN